MLSSPAWQSLDGFVVTDVRDPTEMDERSLLSRRLPASSALVTYKLRDRTLRRGERGVLLARHANRQAGGLQLSHVAERFGTEIGVLAPGIPAYCFGLIYSGRTEFSNPDTDGAVEAGPGQGLVRRTLAGTRATTADDTVRTNLWIGADRFESALRACLDDRLREPLVFSAVFDWASVPGRGLHRLLLHAVDEMPRPGGLADNALALAAFVDLFVHTALCRLPHSHTERLERMRDDAAPGCVRRAESYFREHAGEPVRMQDVAAAAGCSVRSLQRAFRVFRDTTPHAALERTRLDLARAALARDEAGVTSIARRFGFTNAGRFAAAYTSRFGEGPSGTRRSAGRPRP